MIDSLIDIDDINNDSTQITSEIDIEIPKEKSIEFIWYDPNLNNTSIQQLERLLKNMALDYELTRFDTSYGAIEYILQREYNTNFYVLTCGKNGESFVSRVYMLGNVKSIYVFCIDIKKHEKWARAYSPKLSVIENDINRLLNVIMNELKDSSLSIAEKSASLGDEYKFKGKYIEALKYLGKSMEIYQFLNGNSDSESVKLISIQQKIQSIAESYCRIGLIHKDEGEYDGAISEFQQCVFIYQNILRNHNKNLNAGICYKNLGDCYLFQREYEISIVSYCKALEIFNFMGIMQEIWHIIDRLEIFALGFKRNGEYDQAIDFFRRVLSFYHKFTKQYSDHKASRLYTHLGDCYKIMNNYEKSLHNYQEALQIILKLDFEAVNLDLKKSLEFTETYHDITQVTHEQIDYGLTIQSCIESIRLYQNQFDTDHSSLGLISESTSHSHLLYYKYCMNTMMNSSKLSKIYQELKEDEYVPLKKIDYIWLLVDNIVRISTKQGNFIRIINVVEEAFKLCDENDSKIAKYYLQFGKSYKNQKQFSQAMENYSKALRIFQKEPRKYGPRIYSIYKILCLINLELALWEKSKGNLIQASKKYEEAILNCLECLKIHNSHLSDPSQKILRGFSCSDYPSELEMLYKDLALLCKDSYSLSKNSPFEINHNEVVDYFHDFLIQYKTIFANKLPIVFFYVDICKWYGLHLGNNDPLGQVRSEKGLEIIQNHQENIVSEGMANEMVSEIYAYIRY